MPIGVVCVPAAGPACEALNKLPRRRRITQEQLDAELQVGTVAQDYVLVNSAGDDAEFVAIDVLCAFEVMAGVVGEAEEE